MAAQRPLVLTPAPVVGARCESSAFFPQVLPLVSPDLPGGLWAGGYASLRRQCPTRRRDSGAPHGDLDIATRYRDRFAEYDLNNEMLHANYYAERLGPTITKQMVDWGREGDPNAVLYLDSGVVALPAGLVRDTGGPSLPRPCLSPRVDALGRSGRSRGPLRSPRLLREIPPPQRRPIHRSRTDAGGEDMPDFTATSPSVSTLRSMIAKSIAPAAPNPLAEFRRSPVILAAAFSLCLSTISTPALAETPLTLQCCATEVGKYDKIEFLISGVGDYANPFDPDEVDISLQVTAPDGQSGHIPAFYCQEYERHRVGSPGRERDWFYPRGLPVWKARFAPAQTGAHAVVAILKDSQGLRKSAPCRFVCIPSARTGFVRVSQKDPRFLEFSEGQPFFPIGQNLAFIGSQQYVTLSRTEEIFGKLAANGANYLRIWTCCEDWALAIEARKSAWGRSWDWRAPLAPSPEGGGTQRQCLRLSRPGTVLNANPSHPVALRPNTKYRVSVRVWTEGDAELQLRTPNSSEEPLIPASPGAWRTFQHEFQTGPAEFWLGTLNLRLRGGGSAWIDGLSLKESAGGPELLWEADVNRPRRGVYNPLDCFMLDEILAAAEKHGIYLQLCLLTRDLYMDALKDPASADYAQAVADARKFYRHAVARWGYSTSVAAWEYWNEMNPNLPADRFYTALGEYLEQTDPYHHLRTTSTWGPSPRDCHHPKLDFADLHFYLRPSDQGRLRDEVDAVLERTRWLRQQAPRKPAHLGEFGLANEKWQPTAEMNRSKELVDVHNALWASALSGASGTAVFWWWERLDQRNVYPLYRPLAAFVRDVPWNSGQVEPAPVTNPHARLQAVALRADRRVWLWLFNHDASWSCAVLEQRTPSDIQDASVALAQPPGHYRIEWWDTRAGTIVRSEERTVTDGQLRLNPPPFSRDIACKITDPDH
jgi:hypothetical protein